MPESEVAVCQVLKQAQKKRCGPHTMRAAYRSRLERYLSSMLQAKRMLMTGIMTLEDYSIIDTMLAEKYEISSCSLYRGIDLIYRGFRGNMSHYEEMTKCQEQ